MHYRSLMLQFLPFSGRLTASTSKDPRGWYSGRAQAGRLQASLHATALPGGFLLVTLPAAGACLALDGLGRPALGGRVLA